MKKLLWLFIIFASATAVREVVDYFGPMAEAFRAYRDEAHKQALELGKKKSFRHIEGNIVAVSHKLESSERAAEDKVNLVVLEAVHFQKSSERGAFGNRRVAQTRQYVLMIRIDGKWLLSRLEEDATEVVELSDVAESLLE
ncbi:MAG: hypothetical protein E2P02_00875 [Acidobacteria bacterium]|nr:MAG: hypothetical protein E2P02_00875 [Acidobacteriota bacterium]